MSARSADALSASVLSASMLIELAHEVQNRLAVSFLAALVFVAGSRQAADEAARVVIRGAL